MNETVPEDAPIVLAASAGEFHVVESNEASEDHGNAMRQFQVRSAVYVSPAGYDQQEPRH